MRVIFNYHTAGGAGRVNGSGVGGVSEFQIQMVLFRFFIVYICVVDKQVNGKEAVRFPF